MSAENMGLREEPKDGMVKESEARKLSGQFRMQAGALDTAATWLEGIRKRDGGGVDQAAHLLRVQARTLREVADKIDCDICGDIPF